MTDCHNTGEMKAERVEKILRTAYESAFFPKTALHRSIRSWQDANQPFVVLSDPATPGARAGG